ncbi:MAG: hypothetical protein ABS35_41000 [Kaistia sp. SCN 65-12]|nr:MAG: hypothetical protein ABS35_41000 [Kaistia sp. SCN 65-12]
MKPPVPPFSLVYIQRYTRETCLPVTSATFSMPILAITERAGSRCFSLIIVIIAIIAISSQPIFAIFAIGFLAVFAIILT